MAERLIPHYHNDSGVPEIEIGAREFKCIGARPPFDHPHIYIDMGDDEVAICSYCGTAFRYRATLAADETHPPGHLLAEPSLA